MSSAVSSFLKAPLCSIEGGRLPWSVGTTMTIITWAGKGWGYRASLPWGSAFIFWEFFKAACSQVKVWHWPWFPGPRDAHKVESTLCYNHGTLDLHGAALWPRCLQGLGKSDSRDPMQDDSSETSKNHSGSALVTFSSVREALMFQLNKNVMRRKNKDLALKERLPPSPTS